MQESIRSVNPMKKGTPATFTDADTELKETWQILAKQYKDDVEGLVRRLQAEQRMHMFHLLSMQKNDQSEAWVDAYKKCVEEQRLRSGGLTLQMTQDAADTALAQIAAHTTKSKGTTRESNLNKEVTALVTSLLDKRPQDQKGAAGGDRKKRKPTPGKIKSTCSTCGKVHAGECWHKDKAEPPATRAKSRALKAVAKLNEQLAESDISAGSDNESDTHYSCVSLIPENNPLPESCKIMSAQIQLHEHAHPDTQAQVSITNSREHVVKHHGTRVELSGVVSGARISAETADLAFLLQATDGSHFYMRVQKPGLYHADASTVILDHQDLEDAGLHVDYTAGRILTPDDRIIAMEK